MTSIADFRGMDLFELHDAIDKYCRTHTSEEFDEICDDFTDLYTEAWEKEYPNLTFRGSHTGMDKDYDTILGTFKEIIITGSAFEGISPTVPVIAVPNAEGKFDVFFKNDSKSALSDDNSDDEYWNEADIYFDEEVKLDVKSFLFILNKIGHLFDFKNHTDLVGFVVKGNIINIRCNS